ncbi:MAG TPA: SRPBCC family protein [Candidatus Acidoferrum sp.]|nr:SRPBCC family protein [Candidatus Acidoferrum sp.]
MERSVTHATFVIERHYPVSPQRVFAAFADPAKKRRWFSESDDAPAEEFGMDFRVGGFERKRFHVKAGFVCENNTVYRDIVPDRRIVFAYTMSVGDNRISSSHSTVELLPASNGTTLIFTEQAAFFEGADGPQAREHGWGVLFDRLAKALAN